MNEKNLKKEIRDDIIHIAFTKDEKKELKKFAKEYNMTLSEFIRQSAFDKIRKIEHPEIFSESVINPAKLEEITKNTKKMLEMQNVLLEKQNIIEEMNKTLTLMKNFTLKPDLETKNTILNLFKAHSSLNPKEIIDKTNFNENMVFSVISELQNENLIEMTSRGRFKLK